jgi:hypothetical protein
MIAKTGITRCMILLMAAVAMIAAMPSNASAYNCYATGSVYGIASAGTCTDPLVPGQQKLIDISVVNGVIRTDTNVPVSAKLKAGGIIYVTLACTTSDCSTPLSGTLTFVPQPGNGCYSSETGVASCSATGPNNVQIQLDADINLALTGFTPIATILVEATTPSTVEGLCESAPAVGLFHERFVTGDNDIVSTDTGCDAVQTGAAQGSGSEWFPPLPPSVDIVKECEDSTSYEDTTITFDITVTNDGPNTLDCTLTDPDCLGDPINIPGLAPGGTAQFSCDMTGTAPSDVYNLAEVSCTDEYGQDVGDSDDDECSIPPPPPSVDIVKECEDSTSYEDTTITFDITVTNNGPNTLDCTLTDPDCLGDPVEIADLAPGGTAQFSCDMTGTAPSDVYNLAEVSCTDEYGQDVADSDEDTCSIPPPPCSVVIDKKVAPDIDCNGEADSAFGEQVTVDEGVCVVYEICVTNTGQQVLDTAGVEVSDDWIGIEDFNFGTIDIGQTVCGYVASEIPAAQCPDGLCYCMDVAGVNTAYVSSAICQATQDDACIQTGSDCDDDALVECTSAMACRMTGGHNFFYEDAGYEDDDNGTFYTTGGQIGAPTDAGCRMYPQKGKCVDGYCTGGLNGGEACMDNDGCPNDSGRGSTTGPWGEWEHNHHAGPDDTFSMVDGSFAFHSGTASEPDDSFIKSIICADEGWCVQARPAPNKQIFWEGTGVFHNTKTKGKDDLMPFFAACAAEGYPQPVPFSKGKGKDGDVYSLHYYRAHVADFGEPGGTFQNPADECSWTNGTAYVDGCEFAPETEVNLLPTSPNEKFTALHPLCLAQNCDANTGGGCPDFYEIEIHCTADPDSPVAYKVSHFIREGNFQLHPSVGDSCNPDPYCGDGECQQGDGYYEDSDICPVDCLY